MGIAKNMVFLEGQDSSSDRKVFSSLFPQQGGKLKFIPAKSSGFWGLTEPEKPRQSIFFWDF